MSMDVVVRVTFSMYAGGAWVLSGPSLERCVFPL